MSAINCEFMEGSLLFPPSSTPKINQGMQPFPPMIDTFQQSISSIYSMMTERLEEMNLGHKNITTDLIENVRKIEMEQRAPELTVNLILKETFRRLISDQCDISDLLSC